MIKVLADNDLKITASQDSAMYDVFANNAKFIIKGIGNEMLVNNTSLSLQITVDTGEAILCGRHVTITERAPLTLQPNGKYWIALRIDLTQTAQHEGSIIAVANEAQLKNENLNNNGNYNDLLLGIATTNTVGVITFEDKRKIGNDGYVAPGGTNNQFLVRDFNEPSKTKWVESYDKVELDNILNVKEKVVTIDRGSWVGNKFTLQDSLIAQDTFVYFAPPVATAGNKAVILALENANIKAGNQGNGYAEIVCYGDVPQITTYVKVLFCGKLNSIADENSAQNIIEQVNELRNKVQGVRKQIVIKPSEWVNGLYTYSDPLIKVAPDTDQDWSLPEYAKNTPNPTLKAMRNMVYQASIVGAGQDNGKAYLVCEGIVPTKDITVIVTIK